jgi:hypothetical protein
MASEELDFPRDDVVEGDSAVVDVVVAAVAPVKFCLGCAIGDGECGTDRRLGVVFGDDEQDWDVDVDVDVACVAGGALVAMLRYFSEVSSYEQIAVVCELPIGTVRSRLSQVRVKLTEGLSATAEHVHENASAKHEICRQDAVDTLAAANRGAFSEFTARLSPHLEVVQPHGDRGGANLLLTNLQAEHEQGTRRRPVNVVVGGDRVIWETELIDATDNPAGGPPAAAWLMSLDPSGLVRHMRLFELPHHSEARVP